MAETVFMPELTDREIEVLREIADMWSTEQIAFTLFISANTVKTHVASIFQKLNVNGRGDAVRLAREKGII